MSGRSTVPMFIAAWALGGLLSAAYAGVRHRAPPSLRVSRAHVLGTRHLAVPFVLEFVLANGTGQVALYAVSGISGLDAVAAVRAAMTFFGPINIVFSGLFQVAVPTGARLAGREPAAVRGLARSVALVLLFATAAWTLIGVSIPTEIGGELLGDTWGSAGRLIVYFGAVYAGQSLTAGALTGLRALAAADRSLRAQMMLTPIGLVAPIVGSAIADEKGFAIGTFVFASASAALMWSALRGAVDERSS